MTNRQFRKLKRDHHQGVKEISDSLLQTCINIWSGTWFSNTFPNGGGLRNEHAVAAYALHLEALQEKDMRDNLHKILPYIQLIWYLAKKRTAHLYRSLFRSLVSCEEPFNLRVVVSWEEADAEEDLVFRQEPEADVVFRQELFSLSLVVFRQEADAECDDKEGLKMITAMRIKIQVKKIPLAGYLRTCKLGNQFTCGLLHSCKLPYCGYCQLNFTRCTTLQVMPPCGGIC